jgi:hypothetical protein
MEFGKAFSFPFEDAQWFKKIAIPALVGLIPVIGQFVLVGWALETAKRVIRQDPVQLADLEFGSQLGLGFQSFLIGLVYSIPALLIYLPMFAVPLALDNGNSDTMGPVVAIVIACCSGLLVLYGLLLVVIIPAALGNFLASGRMSAAFAFGKVFGLLRAAPGAYLLVILGIMIAGFIAPIGAIACGVGAILTSAYALLISSHLYGQAYRQAVANGAIVD